MKLSVLGSNANAMNEDSYEECWLKHLDTTYDGHFIPFQKQNLAWLPWVGKDYSKSKEGILIVFESHYTNEANIEKVDAQKSIISNNKLYTREVIAEYPIVGLDADWRSPTYDNLFRAILKSGLLSEDEIEMRGRFWNQIAHYNFVQRPMDYGKGRRERPTQDDYFIGWQVFIQIVGIIKPKFCIFNGVEALNTFNYVMKSMDIEHTPIERGDLLNRTYERVGGSVTIDGFTTKIICLKHTSQFFSWKIWNEYLDRILPDSMEFFRRTVLNL